MATHPTTFMPLAAGYPALMGHHRHLLDDEVRTEAFLRAIEHTVRAGDIVADLGTGTGILAIEARRRGASAVYAIEREPVIHLARSIAQHNQIDGIRWIHAHSRDVTLPEEVDVIVSECFGVLAVGGTMIEAVCELRRRHLRSGGRVVPERVTVFVAPVCSPGDHAYIDVWSKPRYGLDLSPARLLARNQPYNTTFAATDLLAAGKPLGTIDLLRDDYRGELVGTARFLAEAREMHGFAAWFVAELGGGVTLSTAPDSASTIWRQVYLPIESVELASGAKVEITLDYQQGQFAWRGQAGDRSFVHDTRASVPSP